MCYQLSWGVKEVKKSEEREGGYKKRKKERKKEGLERGKEEGEEGKKKRRKE